MRTVKFHVGSEEFYAHECEPPSDEYIQAGTWCVHAPTVRDWCKLARIGCAWDSEVPQLWFDTHRIEIQENGGWVIWVYPEGFLFGKEMYADEVKRRAVSNISVTIMRAIINGEVEEW